MEHQQNIAIIKLSTRRNINLVHIGTDDVYRFKCSLDVNRKEKRTMTLYEKLTNKIHEEQEQYLAEIEKLPPKEIIYKAYEICYREEFINILDNAEFTDDVMQALLEVPNPVAELYEKWLHTDIGVWDILEDVIRNYAE